MSKELRFNPVPDRLYHGTTEAGLDRALVEGFKPRSMTGAPTNWKHTIDSNALAVYLTSAYPLHFAANATNDGKRAAVVEIDTTVLDKRRMVADEDALEQLGRGGRDSLPAGWSMVRRTKWYRERILDYPAELSLTYLGTCAYAGIIPPHAIKRAALLTPEAAAHLIIYGFDPQISTLHYALLGKTYERNIGWIFGDSEYQPFAKIPGSEYKAPDRPAGIEVCTFSIPEAA